MILYHGTTYDIWKNICSKKVLQVASKANSPYANQGSKETEYGYVYLVGNEIEAVEYAPWAASARTSGHHCAPRLLVVIKVDVPSCELCEDPVDSKRRPMTYGKGPYMRIKRDIKWNEIVSIAAFQYESFEASCTEIDAWIGDKNLLNGLKWVKPTSAPVNWNGTAKYFR